MIVRCSFRQQLLLLGLGLLVSLNSRCCVHGQPVPSVVLDEEHRKQQKEKASVPHKACYNRLFQIWGTTVLNT